MHKTSSSLLLALILALVSPIISEASSPQAMIQDLKAAKNTITVKYAPHDWKKEYLNWTVEDAYEKAKSRILKENPASDREYQKIFREFLQSTQDYHVRTLFYSSAWSCFPIKLKSAEGRYFIQNYLQGMNDGPSTDAFDIEALTVDITECEENYSKLAVGDEIIAVNGIPVQALIEEIIDQELSGDRSPTGYGLAERLLFLRKGIFGNKTPRGNFELTVKHKGQENTTNYVMPWLHVPEWVKEHAYKAPVQDQQPKIVAAAACQGKKQAYIPHAKPTISRAITKDFSVGFAKDLIAYDFKKLLRHESEPKDEDKDSDDDDDCRNKGALPPIGKILWETEQDMQFYAYLAETPFGKRVGYIYIPDFDCSGKIAEYYINELLEAVSYFNENSDALVIDITNNPGGNLFYMYAVLSTLADTPLKTPTHREKLIQEDAYNTAADYNTIMRELAKEKSKSEEDTEAPTVHGYPETERVRQQVLGYLNFLMKSWESGEKFTQPIHIGGLDEIIPHPRGHYEKPIIVLVNELDFSCGDMFPAILQDNGRATIFGTKTAGAGGYVKTYPHLSQFGVQGFSLTGSIAYRLNGKPIENLGVTPDIICEVTANDLQNNYTDYLQQLHKELHRLIP